MYSTVIVDQDFIHRKFFCRRSIRC